MWGRGREERNERNDRGGRDFQRPPRDDGGERRGFQPNPSFPKGPQEGAQVVEHHVGNMLRDLFGNDVSLRLEDADTHWKLNVVCPRELRGRIIGSQGRMINAVRTIAGAHAAQQKVQVQIDLEE